jgi:uncharacterized protein (DUF305 family)
MMNKSSYLFITSILLLLLLATKPAEAQAMEMHHQKTAPAKNIFLAMMDTMMQKMDDVPKATSPESDFILQMIPHHEGAIAMAAYEIKHGKNFDVVQLAKSILAEQTSDVQQMKLWLKQVPVNNKQVPETYQQAMEQTMMTMMDNMPAAEGLKITDQAFAKVMIPHHQAAVDMAKVVLKFSTNQQTSAFAKQLISAEEVEMEQMSLFLK